MAITLDGTTGITTPGLTNTGTETLVNLTSTGNTTLGDATTDTLTVGVTGIVKDASGNVGIGTSSPAYKLDVTGSATNVAKFQNGSNQSVFVASASGLSGILSEAGNQNGWLMNSASNYVVAYTNGSEKLRLDSSGNLGLGVTPTASSGLYKVVEVGASGNSVRAGTSDQDLYVSCNLYYNSGWKFGGNGYGALYNQYHGTHSWAYTSSNSSGAGASASSLTTAMTLDASGRLGIGNTSPTAGLTLDKYGTAWNTSSNVYSYPAGNVYLAVGASPATDNWIGFTGGYANSSGSANILLQANLFNTSYQAGNFIGSLVTGSSSSDLQFGTMTGGASVGVNASKNEQMRLTNTGNLGIGTTSPQSLLSLYANSSTVAGQYNSPSTLTLWNGNGSASIGGTIAFGGAAPSTTSTAFFASIWSGVTNSSSTGTNGYLAFGTKTNQTDTSVTERARIDSSGNFVQKGATTAAGIKPTAIANNESITTVNSTTYTINLGTSAKLFWISLGNGDGALVFTSYLSSSITFLGITPTNIAATASPSSAQLGISKNANSHDIVIKTGSALFSTAAAWQMGVLSSQVA